MRVLMLVRQFYPWAGGAERQAQKLAKKLIEKGINVKVITGWWDRKAPRRDIIDGIPVIRNFTFWQMFNLKGLRKFSVYIYLLTLFGYLVRHNREYDLIHIHLMNYHAFIGVLVSNLLNKKVIVKLSCSGEFSDIKAMRENWFIPGTKQMLPRIRNADCVIAVSNNGVQELLDAGFQADKIVLIPNGVEVDEIEPKQDYALHPRVTLTFVGRLHPQKRVDVLLHAFANVVEARPEIPWQLRILGDGTLRSELEKLAQLLGLSKTVEFHGQVDNVAEYLAETDIFLLPSCAEGLSNALLEAMAYGLPCVATRIAGNTDVISDGENGLLVEPNDKEALAEAILKLAQDDNLRKRLGTAARGTAEEKFSLESVVGRYIELYAKLCPETPLPADTCYHSSAMHRGTSGRGY